MTARLAINGFGRIGRAVVRAAIERDADLDIVAVNDVFDVATLAQLLQLDSVYGRFPHPVGTDGDAIVVAGRRIAVTAAPEPGGAAVGGAVRRRRHRGDRAVPHARGRRGAPARGRPQGDPLRAGQGRRSRRRRRGAGCELRHRLRPRAPPHHHQRLVHDELPGARRQGPARDGRHPARPDDHHPRLHRRPEPARRTAQGPAARPRRRRSTWSRRRPAPRRPSGSSSRSSRGASTASRCGCRSPPGRSST